MAKMITTKGAIQAAIDIVLMALYFIGGVAGIMYASVLQDLTMWFFVAAGILLLFTALEIAGKVTKPMDSYESKEVVG